MHSILTLHEPVLGLHGFKPNYGLCLASKAIFCVHSKPLFLTFASLRSCCTVISNTLLRCTIIKTALEFFWSGGTKTHTQKNEHNKIVKSLVFSSFHYFRSNFFFIFFNYFKNLRRTQRFFFAVCKSKLISGCILNDYCCCYNTNHHIVWC